MERLLLNSIVIIATGAAVIKFAMLEWEGIAHTWARIARLRSRRKVASRDHKTRMPY